MDTAIIAIKNNKALENIAKSAIMDADVKTLCTYAKQLARQLSDEQLREMINNYTKGV